MTVAVSRAASNTEATGAEMVYGTACEVEAAVTSTVPVAGEVELLDGDAVIDTATLAEDGTATLDVPGTALRRHPPADRPIPR